MGAYYGATTLVQLFTTPRPGTAVMSPVEVRDYPDIPCRMSADWVLQWDWEVNGYDWGDGLAAFLARCKRKIDLCSRYKVNRVRFLGGRIAPGPAYMTDRYERIKRFALELNRYARRKGVALQFSSSSWGQDYYNWGLPYPEPWILNRESYPDGPVYSCVGGTVGGCFSNDALIERVATRHKQLVRDLEPGSIYLHQIDVATYAELVELWKIRCPRCRQRFPDDEPCSARGYAAAVAHLYNRDRRRAQVGPEPAERLRRLPRPGNRLCLAGLLVLRRKPTPEWEKDLKYFAEIGRQLTRQEERADHLPRAVQAARRPRPADREMAGRWSAPDGPRAPFVFAVQGGGFIFGYSDVRLQPGAHGDLSRRGDALQLQRPRAQRAAGPGQRELCLEPPRPGSVDPLAFHGRALQEEAARYATGDAAFGFPLRPLSGFGLRSALRRAEPHRRWPPCFAWSARKARSWRSPRGSISNGRTPASTGGPRPSGTSRPCPWSTRPSRPATRTPRPTWSGWPVPGGRDADLPALRRRVPREAAASRNRGPGRGAPRLAGEELPVSSHRARRRRSRAVERPRQADRQGAGIATCPTANLRNRRRFKAAI